MITPAELPVPAVEGGAIETLMDILIAENEQAGKLDLTIYSYGTKQAAQLVQNNQYSTWDFYWKNPVLEMIYKVISKGVRVFSLRKKSLLPLWTYVVAFKLRHKTYDVVLVEGCPHMVKPLKRAGKVLLHIHTDLMYPGMPFACSAYRDSDRIIAVSAYIADRIRELGQDGDTKVSVVPNCVDTMLFNGPKYQHFRHVFRQQHGIGPHDKVFYFCGRIDQTKGVDHVVKAFCALPDDNIWLIVIGSSWFDGSPENEFVYSLKEYAQHKKDRILFTGYIPHSAVAQYIAACDVAVLPSICNEAALLTAMEAISSGVPVITTDRGGIPEYAAENAVILPVDDELDQNLLNAMRLPYECYPGTSETRRAFCEKYSTKNYYLKMFKAIEDTVKHETAE